MKKRFSALLLTLCTVFLTAGCSLLQGTALTGNSGESTGNNDSAFTAGSGDTTIRILSGSENQELEDIISDCADKAGVRIEMDYQGSVDIMRELQSGAAGYDAVWPASSMWLSLGDSQHLVKHSQSVSLTPVVFGIRQSLAEELGFTDKCEITESIHKQSPDISMGVDSSFDDKDSSGAGDQGIMFGYAIDETEEEMPLALTLARNLTDLLTEKREKGELSYLRPDGKSQVTVEYEKGKIKRIEAVVVSAQHDEKVSLETLRKDIMEKVILAGLPESLIDDQTKFFINPTGRFVLGGPAADTGLTGRKLIVDTYGSKAHHGGGAFSGKDPSKVDRSAAYALRNIAKSIVKSGIAKEAELQIAYAIGVAKPVSLELNTFGTSKKSEEEILKVVEKHYDLRPDAIIKRFDLRKPKYLKTAEHGHFGRSDYSWEKVNDAFISDLKAL